MTQNGRIISLDEWLLTPTGRYLLAWEQQQLDRTVGDLFGFHAVQLGLPQLEALAQNRMPHRWVALDRAAAPLPEPPGAAPDARVPRAVLTDFEALPFETHSLDLVVLPHTLELSRDPHQTLREVERVLVPEGKVVVLGLNPASLWGVQQRSASLCSRLGLGTDVLPPARDMIGYWRLRDWLRLLSFDIEGGRFGCWRPALRSELWLERFGWMERSGERWWPVLGAAYFLVATKRVRGMRLINPAWKGRQATQRAPAVAASRRQPLGRREGGGS
ncbi:class I SAM-dependent methyltransferase [Aquabacterium sp. A7-Y]|uniref:class I SAM-dependent methyltransferase n=1 Tax=Aquabacterium sp. A7-Y TaxID=1349605 RepID=UPI00223DBA73|nr:methyltransferase domain-containing protein [Aquabacterium sp. A7-Y]MCW7540381.1 class I SAM-dependent methyltransferase [Aquabacterium sp. A7-Y]